MSASVLATVLADLEVESGTLDALVAGLDEAGWRTETPAAGWDVAASVAHLAWTDEVAAAAACDPGRWEAIVLEALADPGGYVDAAALAGAAVPPAELLARWREARRRLADTLTAMPAGHRLPWFGPPMSASSMATARYMETWAHGLDVTDALGIAVTPHLRVRHVVHLGVRTRAFSFAGRGLPVPEAPAVRLTAPGGEQWTYGPDEAVETVTGPAWDFALLVTQRRHRDDLALVATGAGADRWLDIAQAFAGPAGAGRAPSGSARG